MTLLEKSDKVGGVSKTEIIQGKSYGISVMFVPGESIDDLIIKPTPKQIIGALGDNMIP